MTSPLDAQLHERARKRRVHRGELFGREFFVQARFSPAARLFGFRLVDALGLIISPPANPS
jgi:hypothetical protein